MYSSPYLQTLYGRPPSPITSTTNERFIYCRPLAEMATETSNRQVPEYDIIICGGGTAGCTLAARLTEDPNITVLVLEAGQDANADPNILTPGAAVNNVDNPACDWCYVSEPNKHMHGRSIPQPRGKMLGGSSALNFMAVLYPSKALVDAWGALGNEGWSWEDLEPYYKKFRTIQPPSQEVKEALGLGYLDDDLTTVGGPIQVSYPVFPDLMSKTWMDVFDTLGKRLFGSYMTGAGIGGYTTNASVDARTGTRSHAGVGFLAPALKRANLTVVTHAQVQKLRMENEQDGVPEIKGVEFFQNGHKCTVAAKREVILCAGTFGSPQILELSGIGRPEACQAQRIESVVELPGVGENLQDHIMCAISHEVHDSVPTVDSFRDPAVLQAAVEQYQADRTGPLASPVSYQFCNMPLNYLSGAEEGLEALVDDYLLSHSAPLNKAQARQYDWIRKTIFDPEEATATYFVSSVQMHWDRPGMKDHFALTDEGHYISIGPGLAHPFSRGSVHIQSSDASVPPKINTNYLSHPLDLEIMARHMMQVEQLFATAPLSSLLLPGGRSLPGKHTAYTLEAAKELVKSASISNYHPCGTCAMMPRELDGVVDARLRVYGIRGLRVVDASVFPIEPRGNIVTTVYAVAEKAADMIKEDLGLCKSSA